MSHWEWTEFHERMMRKYGIDASDRIVRWARLNEMKYPIAVALAKAENWWIAYQFQHQD
jgi:hypothetical protein